MNMNPPQRIPNYELLKVIGSGSFGYVFEAIDRNTNKKVALKRIEKVGTQLSREYEILFEVKDSDHVVKILDFYYTRSNNNKLVQNIVFEYMDDNLENMIQNYKNQKKEIGELTIKTYIYQVLKGLKFIHSKGIAHRDLKPENILFDRQERVKICDFGSSKIIDQMGKNTPYIVSRYYRAPELILCISKYTTAIDIWATGCIIAELITREPIFQGKTEGDQLFAIFKIIGSPTKEDLEFFSQQVPFDSQLFKEFKTYKGISLKDLFSQIHDIDNLLDLLNKMFRYQFEKRITAEEALRHPFFSDVADE